ncbi:hypothetical protein ACFZDG_35535 [Kitasatospora xanthocidica]|uniref:hypothetical protein n=1 Tax=Kitasatospora xanthocidica TaxID=83382 RepID=UPI0036E97B4F
MPDHVSPSGPDGPHSPFANKWFIASGVFLGSVVLFGGGWIVLGDGDKKDVVATSNVSAPPATPGGGTQTPLPAPSGTTSSAAACPQLPDTNQAPLTTSNAFAPGELTWTDFKGYRVPEAAASGPAVHSGDVARCYAHTPRGAVLALAQTSIRSANSDNWRPVIEQQVAAGPERDAYLQFVTAARVNPPTTPSSDFSNVGTFAGFQLVSYTNDTVVVDFAIKFPTTDLYRTIVLTAVWQDGDWRQKMTTTGQQSTAVSQQRTLTGYVPFGPGS